MTCSSLESRLDAAVTTYLSETCRRMTTRFDALAHPTEKSLVLAVAGPLGHRTLMSLRKVGIEPLAFADNNPARWNTTFHGVKIISVPEAVSTYGDKAAFVVTVFNGSGLHAQLQSLGCSRVIHFGHLYRQYPQAFLPFGGVAQPADLAEQRAAIREGLALWDDELSREEYVAQMQWRVGLDGGVLPQPLSAADTYFPDDLFTLGNDEVFADCGAFDGDSIRDFLRRRPAFRGIIGFEPDPENCRRLQEFVAKLEPAAQERFQVHPLAVASYTGSIHFEATASAGSTVKSDGALVMNCARLDEILASTPPTFLKMDIEGNEMDALEGARETIVRHQPILAICVYHKPDDLWRIPMFLRALNPRYKLFLRRYAEDCWELVCYAVPVERLKG